MSRTVTGYRAKHQRRASLRMEDTGIPTALGKGAGEGVDNTGENRNNHTHLPPGRRRETGGKSSC